MPLDLKIVLDEEGFRKLVAGQVVQHEAWATTVEIALADIGFDRMIVAISDATERINDATKKKPFRGWL